MHSSRSAARSPEEEDDEVVEAGMEVRGSRENVILILAMA